MKSSNLNIFNKSKKLIPGGVNSPVRAYNAVGINPPIIRKGKGPYIYDEDGNEYVDLVNSWGANILGHAHPKVVEAISTTASAGISFGATTKNEMLLAEKIIDRVQKANRKVLEKIRLVSSGTEATMTAIRLARGITGKDKIVKFAGHYHGHSDSLLVNAGSGVATLNLQAHSGIPESVQQDTIVIEYNNPAELDRIFQTEGDNIAAVITEAASANMGVVKPQDNFNSKIAELTKKYDALFILDEVLTGFRVSSAGWWGYDKADYIPDIFIFGKVIGGGLPVAALAGKAEILDYLAPVGPVYQAGTLSGNPVAVASGLATLELANQEVYTSLDNHSRQIVEMAEKIFKEKQLNVGVQTAGNLFSFTFGNKGKMELNNYSEMKSLDPTQYALFFQGLLEARIYTPPSMFEAWFVSNALDENVLGKIFQGIEFAAGKLATSL